MKSPNKRSTTAIDTIIGSNLRKHRIMRGLSQADLGRILGVSFQQIQKYERATNRVALSSAKLICDNLGIQVEDLLAGLAEVDVDIAKVGNTRSLSLFEPFSRITNNDKRLLIVQLAKYLAEDDRNTACQGDSGKGS